MFWRHSNKTVGHKLTPVRRRPRTLYSTKYKPLHAQHSHEIHHIHFQRSGGSDDSSNLKKLTVEQHRALHNEADRPLRSKNGKKVLSRKGYASQLGKRRQEIHRSQVGETHYSSYMSKLAKRRWKVYHANQKQKGRISLLKAA